MDNKYLNLDVRSLHTFLVIIETGSITAAANQLNITQSAVSHGLEKLRGIFQDQLFIRAGRGIKPTPRAEQLFKELKPLLANINALTQQDVFEPADASISWTIAANDFQRDIVLPAFYERVSKQIKHFSLDVIPSDMPPTELLRNGEVDLVISPVPPDAPDILQKQLFSSKICCFYDSKSRGAPKTTEDFLQSKFISLTFMAGRRRTGDDPIMEKLEKNIVVRVSNFAGIASFLRDSELLAIVPEMLRKTYLADFSQADFPFGPPELRVYMLWHQRYQNDAAHKWLRTELLKDL
jgi:DNA-binding transcriptional LysR family regulator